MEWYIYILQCFDGSFYVGHTENIEQRIASHNAGTGAVFTKNRRPVVLVYSECRPTKSAAILREKQIKGWSRAKKEALISGNLNKLHQLARRRK